MKAIIVATFAVAVSVIAASVYFAISGDSVAPDLATETISDAIPVPVSSPKKEVVQSHIESTLPTDPASTPPILDIVRKKIEAAAAASHPGDVSTQLVVIKNQTEGYRELEGFLRPDGIPENVFQNASRRAEESHVDDYAAQLTVIKEQLKGYRELKSLERPANVPDEVIRAVARATVERHPSSLSEQFSAMTNQLSAYQALQELECPADIPEKVFREVIQKAAGISHPSDFSTLLREIENNLKTHRKGSTNAATR